MSGRSETSFGLILGCSMNCCSNYSIKYPNTIHVSHCFAISSQRGEQPLTDVRLLNTISNFFNFLLMQVCYAILDELRMRGSTVLQHHRNGEPRLIGSESTLSGRTLGGIHIAMKCSSCGGSEYFNYKKFHSIIMMALVDGDLNIMWVEVGQSESAGDAQSSNKSELKECIE
ncbi:hypothetical protein MAR_012435 [Mya arenaria]|uniref:Uncharacterized protein n=1 Tax=Mya arenaria TaxID=6604 RepID=A0ABY7G0Z1_MYAAR|nr:hypothetical protein MAR_012435 [Mya arenaria]